LPRCCFEDAREDPSLRPGAARWQQALEEAEKDLTTCPQNTQHRYARGLDVCPWCLLARQQGRDPFPPAEEVQARSSEAPRQSSTEEPVRTDGTGPVSGENSSGPDAPREHPGPPVPPTAAVGKPGWAEAALRKVGALVERHGWVAWPGAILVSTVAGLLWALQHAAAPAPMDQARPVTADRREGKPATPPAAPPPAPEGGGRPREPVPAPPGPPLLTPGEFQEATYAYLSALQAYQEAVAGSLRGEVSQEEVDRFYRKVQAAQRRQQAGWQAVADAISGRAAPRSTAPKLSAP
jgi:hypothetical protein